MVSILEVDQDRVKVNHHAKYLGQRPFDHAHLWVVGHFWVVCHPRFTLYRYMVTCVQNVKTLASAVPEIWKGRPKMQKFGRCGEICVTQYYRPCDHSTENIHLILFTYLVAFLPGDAVILRYLLSHVFLCLS